MRPNTKTNKEKSSPSETTHAIPLPPRVYNNANLIILECSMQLPRHPDQTQVIQAIIPQSHRHASSKPCAKSAAAITNAIHTRTRTHSPAPLQTGNCTETATPHWKHSSDLPDTITHTHTHTRTRARGNHRSHAVAHCKTSSEKPAKVNPRHRQQHTRHRSLHECATVQMSSIWTV